MPRLVVSLHFTALRAAALALVSASVGCTADVTSDSPTFREDGSKDKRGPGQHPGATEADGGSSSFGDAEPPPLPTPSFASLTQLCKLISGRNLDEPTPNNTHFRANLRGTDLGIPVAHGDDLFLFFGDTAGVRAIWPLGPESLPDAVGFASWNAVKKDPRGLCSGLRFLAGSPENSAGRAQDSRIERDFAGAWMTPPPGRSIDEFIHNPSGPRGAGAFPNLPGDFEVPSGAFSHGGSIFVFYTTVVSPTTVEMKGSYLARWTAPSTTGLPSYEILHHVDQRFDANGPLRGDFINIAPVVVGDWLYLYGSGDYRKSSVHLARKPLAMLEQPGGFERFDAVTRTWRPAGDPDAKPVVVSPTVGELSVRWFPEIGRYVMLNQETNPNGNQVVARFANAPEGPWSEAIPIATMTDPAFAATYCCIGGNCSGKRLFNCERAGFYGTYMLPEATVNPDGSFAIAFTMSTWDPYNVALMSATFVVPQSSKQ